MAEHRNVEFEHYLVLKTHESLSGGRALLKKGDYILMLPTTARPYEKAGFLKKGKPPAKSDAGKNAVKVTDEEKHNDQSQSSVKFDNKKK